MNEILKQFTPNNIAGGSYERLSIVSLINNLDARWYKHTITQNKAKYEAYIVK